MVSFSPLIGHRTINIPEIIFSVRNVVSFPVSRHCITDLEKPFFFPEKLPHLKLVES